MKSKTESFDMRHLNELSFIEQINLDGGGEIAEKCGYVCGALLGIAMGSSLVVGVMVANICGADIPLRTGRGMH